jgi:hypothetical protein
LYLENLYKLEIGKTTLVGNYTSNIIYKIGSLCILVIDSNDAIYNKKFGDVLFNIPQNFRPATFIPITASCLNTNESVALRIHPNGDVVFYSAKQINTALYINASYFAN